MKEIIVLIDTLMVLIAIINIVKLKNKKIFKSKEKSILFNSDNTDNGVPANIVFEQLKDLEIDYLGMKSK